VPFADRPGDAGFLTVQYVAAVALSLVLVVQLANLLVVAYARGAVRAALDEGVRAAAMAGAEPSRCEQRGAAVLDDLLGGPMGEGVGPVACRVSDDGALLTATADTSLPAWVPGLRDASFSTRATAVRETGP
jgi:hypothetical protein